MTRTTDAHRVRRAMAARLRRARGDRGSGTMLVLVVMMLLFFTGGATSLIGSAVAVRHRAETAADLAALSGASALQRGSTAPCTVARRIANSNGAALLSCLVNGAVVEVAVAVAPHGPLARLPPARGRARAGPVQ